MTHRNQTMTAPKPESPACSGSSMEETYLLAMRCPVYRRRDSNPGFRAELEKLAGDEKGRGASGSPARPHVPELGQLATGGTRRFRRKAAAFTGWHEPDKSRGLRPVL